MPRKTPQNKKSSPRSTKKVAAGDDGKVEQGAQGRKSKEEVGEGERSRRSSTAAQTAASVAESRVTRTRTNKRDSSSPSDSRRTTSRDVGLESSMGRVRSSRRSAGRVNYKESDGEEEASTPKNEDTFDSNEEFEDSESDEKNKPKAKRASKSPPKPRAAAKQKGKGRGGGRGRPAKRKIHTVEELEGEKAQEPIDISDDSADQLDSSTDQKKNKIDSQQDEAEESLTGRKRSRMTTKQEPVDKPSRKSSRGAAVRSTKVESPVSRRPSRNKQIKKYIEVDEDFDEEVKSENEEKEEFQQEVKEVSRKRKREPEFEPNKKAKKEHDQESSGGTSEPPLSEDAKVSKKSADDVQIVEDESSDEPMEIDQSISEPEQEKERSGEFSDKGKKEKQRMVKQGVESSNEPEVLYNSRSHPEKTEDHPVESDRKEGLEDSIKETKSVESEKVEDLSVGNKDNAPGVIKSPEKEQMQSSVSEEKKDANRNAVNCIQSSSNQLSSHDNTFLSNEPVTNTSGVGESEKTVINDATEPLDKNKSFHYQNSTAPKANGTHSDSQQISPNQQISVYSGREYVTNKTLSLDLMKELKGNSLHFGLASYNFSSSHKDKIVSDLDKDVSIICLQNVSKSVFHDILESHFDTLGFKAAVSWPKDCDLGLATFYKTSLFRLNKVVETSVQKLILKKLESSNLGEHVKSAISECLGKCGNVLLTQLDSALEENITLAVANVKIPSSTVSLHALQVACLSQELAMLSDHNAKHVLLCGEFNVLEADISYLLLRHGKLSEQILNDLEDKAENAQSAAVVKLLRNVVHHPSLKLSSCYALALGKELTIPESKITSPNLLWVSADSIHTVGVVDLPLNYSERLSQGQVPLKADVAIALPFPPKTSL